MVVVVVRVELKLLSSRLKYVNQDRSLSNTIIWENRVTTLKNMKCVVISYPETFSCRRDDILGHNFFYDIQVNKLLIGPKHIFSQFAS